MRSKDFMLLCIEQGLTYFLNIFISVDEVILTQYKTFFEKVC